MENKTGLFHLIDSWETANIELAFQIIKNKEQLKISVQERYQAIAKFK